MFSHRNKDMLVLMFGKLNVETEESEQKDISVKKLYLEGTSEQEIFSTVVSASYTNFRCELTGVQVREPYTFKCYLKYSVFTSFILLKIYFDRTIVRMFEYKYKSLLLRSFFSWLVRTGCKRLTFKADLLCVFSNPQI